MATTTNDYYETLGVSRGASDQEIRAAFRRLARQWHPDAHPNDPRAAERFKAITEAYSVLSDPEKRRRYDRFGGRWEEVVEGQPGAGTAGEWSAGEGPRVYGYGMRVEDLEDLFQGAVPLEDLFGAFAAGTGTSGSAGPRPGHDVVHPVRLTLEEAFHGTTRAVELRDAHGARRIDVRIPAGAADGLRLRVAGQGAPGTRGGRPGDLYLEVRVDPHPNFQRDGDNLRTRLQVPVWTLLLGGEVTVRTLSGTVSLKVPPETDDGSLLRLRGQGMPRLGAPEQRGDLLVEVHAQLPHGLSAAERELVSRLSRREGAQAAATEAHPAWRTWLSRLLGPRGGQRVHAHSGAW
jgi:curved DNA-binding protein